MISYVAMDRILEDKMPSNEKLSREAVGRPTRSLANPLSEEELVAKLRSFGIDLDRELMATLCDESLSAEEIARPLIAKRDFQHREEKLQGDWIWVCLDALWRRWHPEKPSFEMLDDKMQAGYALISSGDLPNACLQWLEAWKDLLFLFDKKGFQSILEFDEHFNGTQSLHNWIQDLDEQLWRAGMDDPDFLPAQIEVAEKALAHFADLPLFLKENFRRSIADGYFSLDQFVKADEMYCTWIEDDSEWGWGWIGWADCYWSMRREEPENLQFAMEILQEGLAVPGVRDRKELEKRLADLYEEQGRGKDSIDILQHAAKRVRTTEKITEIMPGMNVVRIRKASDFGEKGLPLDMLPAMTNMFRDSSASQQAGRPKIGRNDPCPCGSGKKYKKCCGES